MYGIRYNKFVADGDSSVYKKILDSRPYKNLTVQKIECRNHLLRNFINKLKDLTTQKSAGKLENRRLLGKNLLRIRKGIITAIRYRKLKNHSIYCLKSDILNSINHVFGKHLKCDKYFCNKPEEPNYMDNIAATDNNFYINIMTHLNYLAKHSKSLIEDMDSNVVESFNSVIAKLIGGKRINFALRRSYTGRCALATVTKNTKRPMYIHYISIY